MTRITLQPAFLLHAYPFRETSLLLEWFTRDYGRVSGIARGAKRSTSPFRGLLQSFNAVLVSWVGRGECVTITGVEPQAERYVLSGDALLCGFYLNELLIKLFHRHDPSLPLFNAYQQTIETLSQSPQQMSAALRIFEKRLLTELGYALVLDREARSLLAIDPQRYYHYVPTVGLLSADSDTILSQQSSFLGEHLLALHQEHLGPLPVLREAKRLLRLALDTLLDKKIIHSRELFVWREQYEH